MPRGEIRKTPKPTKKKTSPEASKSTDVSQHFMSTTRSQSKSKRPTASRKKGSKKESRSECVPVDYQWMKKEKTHAENSTESYSSSSEDSEDAEYSSKGSQRNRSRHKEDTQSSSVNSDDAESPRVEMRVQRPPDRDIITMATAFEQFEAHLKERSEDSDDGAYSSKESRRDRPRRKEGTKSSPVNPDDPEAQNVRMLVQKLHNKDEKTVANGLEELETYLSTKYLPDFLKGWTLTIGSALANIVQDGKTSMALLAARTASLVCVQLGDLPGADIDRMYTVHLRPALLKKLDDKSADSSLRALCAEAIGIFELMATNVSKMIREILELLISLVINLSDGKGIGIPPQTAAVCIAALRSWCLIISGSSSENTIGHSITWFSKLQNLLRSTSVELRVASGKAMALLCELAEEKGMVVMQSDELRITLHTLANDKKVEAKYEQQKTFRDVLNTYEKKKAFKFVRKIKTETIYIDSWVKMIQFDAFCGILRSGLDAHLKRNQMLRNWFNLESPLLFSKEEKPNPHEKRYNYAVAFKARTQARNKARNLRDEKRWNYESD